MFSRGDGREKTGGLEREEEVEEEKQEGRELVEDK